MTVIMRHPELADGQTIEVDELAVPHHRAAGWFVDGEKTPEATTKPTTTARRRRSNEESS